jgi:Animal haem peroxidase
VTPAMADDPAPTPPHGAELRGMDLMTQSPTTEGRFGFMFKNQPPLAASDTLLTSLGQTMEEKPVIGTPLTDPVTGAAIFNPDGSPVLANKDNNDSLGENPNPLLTSGFTFVGQFVDHDITFDTTPLDQQQADPYATTNFRTPRYDLDAIYGRGPSSDPQFYDPNDRDKFLIVKTPYTMIRSDTLKTPGTLYDVPRNASTGKAIIADPRNDQTEIILQLHVAFQMFHNKLVDQMRKQLVPRSAVFESARRMARWHYQWMVIHEFLPAIVGQAMADSVYKEVLTGVPIINIKYYKPTNPLGRPFIPVEFSVAAYRFGHSITRPRYTVQDYVTSTGALVEVKGVPLFEATPTDNNLNGSRPLQPRLRLQWSKFFNDPLAPKNPDGSVPRTARPVRQFDGTLATPLFMLPPQALPDTNTAENLLAVRNLHRGKKMGLTSGQQIARLMGVTPLTNAELWQSHRIEVKIPIPTTEPTPFVSPAVANVVQVIREFDVENQDLKQVLADPAWNGEAPLWFYILKEAEIVGRGRNLGPVGGRIVAEVLVGLLQKDLNSYLYLNAAWKPAPPIARVYGQFTMADLLKFTGIWS